MNFFLTVVLDGLIQASWLFIVALGLTLVFGVLKILNIAHGSFYALGAYLAASAVTMAAAKGLPPAAGFIAMLLAAAFVAAAVGLMLERGLLKMFYGRDEVVLLIVSAVIHNEEMSASMGVKVKRVYALAFAFGVLLAAFAGALTAPKISVQPGLSSDVIILSFAIVVIGGLGSIEGAALGAILVGL